MPNIKKIVKIFLFIICLLLLLFGGVKYFLPEAKKFQKLKKRDQEIKAKIKVEEGKKKELIEEERNLRSNSFFLEKIARDKLGLAKKEDLIYRFKNREENRPEGTSHNSSLKQESSGVNEKN